MARCGCGGGTCNCYLQVSDGLSLTGSGSIANPYLIGLDDIDCDQVRPCLAAGDGISYDPATGIITLRPSTDDGNQLEIGSDGGAYAGVDCSLIRPCLSAGDGITYDSVTGLISARPSTDTGNNLIIGGDGGLFVPSGAATVNTGCGLTGDGSGGAPLAVGVGTWPYACSLDDNAGLVFCDSDGNLRTPPLSGTDYQEQIQATAYPPTLVPTAADVLVESRPFNITNTDPCRDAYVIHAMELDIDFQIPPGGRAMGGINTDDMTLFHNTGDINMVSQHVQTMRIFHRVVPAGGILSAAFNVHMGLGSNGAQYTRIQTGSKAFIFHLG